MFNKEKLDPEIYFLILLLPQKKHLSGPIFRVMKTMLFYFNKNNQIK